MRPTLTVMCFAIPIGIALGLGESKAQATYHGKSPYNITSPGRCICQWHGPRGGCTKWLCGEKVPRQHTIPMPAPRPRGAR